MKTTRKELQDMTSALDNLLEGLEYDEKNDCFNAGDSYIYPEECEAIYDLRAALYTALMKSNKKNPWELVTKANNYKYTIEITRTEETTKEETK